MRRVCCEMKCNKEATWELFYGPAFEDYTHSCDEHKDDLVNPKDVITADRITGNE